MRHQNSGYDAFVSYSHLQDRALAEALQLELQRFACPWYRPRALRIFRDTTNLSASPGLWLSVEQGLNASSWFVLIASPASASSAWVQRETEWWLNHRDADHVLIALTDGDIQWAGHDFDWTLTNSIPRQLSGRFTDEPFWIDLRKLRPSETSGVADSQALPHLGDIVAEFAAPIRGRDKDTLVGEHIRYQRRVKWAVRSVVATLAALLLAVSVVAYIAVNQRARAVTQARIATSRQIAANSGALLNSHLEVAQLLAVEAYRMDKNPQARSALFQAVTSSPALVRFLPADGPVSAIASSADGKVVVAGTDNGQIMRSDVAGGASMRVAQLAGRIRALSADGGGSVIGAADGAAAMVWTRDQGAQPVSTSVGSGANGIAVSPSGRFVVVSSSASATEGNTAPGPTSVLLLDRQSGRTKQVTTDLQGGFAVAMPTDTELVVGNATGGWERRSVPEMALTVAPTMTNVGVHAFALSFSPNGAFFSFTNGGSTIPIWSTAHEVPTFGDPDLVALSHGSDPEAVTVSADGKRVAVADAGTIYVSDTAQGTPGSISQVVLSGTSSTTGVVFLGDDDHLLSSSGSSLALWDLNQLTRISRQANMRVGFACSACPAPSVNVRPDGQQVSVLTGDASTVIVRGLGQHVDQTVIGGGFGDHYGLLGWSADSTKLFLSGPDNSVEIRDAASGAPSAANGPPGSPGYQVLARSPDGRRLVEVDQKGNIRVQDSATGRLEKAILVSSRTNGYNFLVDPSGSVVAETTISSDLKSSLMLFDLSSGGVHAVGAGEVNDVAFGGHHLLVQRKSGVFEVWDVAGTTLQRLIRQDPSYLPGSSSVQTAPVVAGSLLIQQRSDGSLTATDLDTGEVLGSLALPASTNGRKTGMAVTADTRQLITVTESRALSDDGGLLVEWNVSVHEWIRAACAATGRDLTAAEWRTYVGTALPHNLSCIR
jgi:WD40 repeat protein